MYYIDAVESEMVLFDFPEIAPATESSSDGDSIGSKFVKVVKFIAKKIKEFIQKIIELIKKLLGFKNKYKALDIKNQALKDFKVRIKSYLPDKEVTDLTKIKGLSSYTGGESGPYISVAQAESAERAVEQSLEYIISKYSEELSIYRSDIQAINENTAQGGLKLKKYCDESTKASLSNDQKTAVYEMTNAINSVYESAQAVKNSKDDIISTRDSSKKKMLEKVASLVSGGTNSVPDEVTNVVKSIINRYSVAIKTALRDSDPMLNKYLHYTEEQAKLLKTLADTWDVLTKAMTYDDPFKKVIMDGSKLTLEFSKDIFIAINTIKSSVEGNMFEGLPD